MDILSFVLSKKNGKSMAEITNTSENPVKQGMVWVSTDTGARFMDIAVDGIVGITDMKFNGRSIVNNGVAEITKEMIMSLFTDQTGVEY